MFLLLISIGEKDMRENIQTSEIWSLIDYSNHRIQWSTWSATPEDWLHFTASVSDTTDWHWLHY